MISAEHFQSLMRPLGPWGARVAVGVSGGADSLCLAWLLKDWGEGVGLIVDHGLRPESGGEASLTKARLSAFGMEARVIRLTGLAPGPGLAERARRARYAAMIAACQDLGLSDLLLGHHAADQAETVLMRQGARSGPAGLAGMASVSEHPAVRFVRPLLSVPPGLLRATLRAAGIDWVEDPSNTHPYALRTRLRRLLASDGGRLSAGLLATAADAADARAGEALRIAAVLAQRANISPEGYAILSPGPIEPACLGALIRMLGGHFYPPDTKALARLAARPEAATLGGIRLMQAGRLGSGTLLVREPACIGPDVVALDGAVWDGRFRLGAGTPLPSGTSIAALGGAAASLRHVSGLPFAVLRSLPAFWNGGRVCAVPHLGYPECGGAFTVWTNLRCRLTLCPPYPAAGAAWMGDAQTSRTHHVPG